jgi:osmotically-inducible protein OsmY
MFIASGAIESNRSASSDARCLSAESAQARLAHDVRLALRRSGHAELRNVDVVVDGERLLITGSVPSFYLKQLAQELARTVAPRYQIHNELAVLCRAR